MNAGVSSTFTMTCPCGETFEVVEGREHPHQCRPISAQQVRDAWAEGYEFARRESVGVADRGSADEPTLDRKAQRKLRDVLYYWFTEEEVAERVEPHVAVLVAEARAEGYEHGYAVGYNEGSGEATARSW